MHSERRVDHRVGVEPHPTGADRVVQRFGLASDRGGEPLGVFSVRPRINLGTPIRLERGGGRDAPARADCLDQQRQIARIAQIVRL